MSNETLPLFSEELPMDNPNAKKISTPENKLPEMMRKLMDKKGVNPADIEKALSGKIAWTTLMAWYRGIYKTQLLDERLALLAAYFEVSLEYLCFGIGADEESETLKKVGGK